MERSSLVRRTAPFAVFAAILAGIVAVASARSGGSEPRRLPIAAAAGDSARSASGGAEIAVPPTGSWSDVTVADALLAGLPAEAPVRTVSGGRDWPAALAKAFGIGAAPQRDPDGGDTARDGDGPELRVGASAGRPWTYNAAAPRALPPASPKPVAPPPDTAVSSRPTCSLPHPPDHKASCPSSPPPSPSDGAVRAAAAPVLAALGLADEPSRLAPGWGATTLLVSPVVAGLPTYGMETRLEVDASGRIVGASGFLGTSEHEGDYPLLDVRAALARGGGGGVPEPAIACDGGCPTPAPRAATAVRLGLLMTGSFDGDEAFLVPAWLLSFDGAYEQPVLALPDRYLATPPPGIPGEVVDGGAGTGGNVGTAGGVAPAQPAAP